MSENPGYFLGLFISPFDQYPTAFTCHLSSLWVPWLMAWLNQTIHIAQNKFWFIKTGAGALRKPYYPFKKR